MYNINIISVKAFTHAHMYAHMYSECLSSEMSWKNMTRVWVRILESFRWLDGKSIEQFYCLLLFKLQFASNIWSGNFKKSRESLHHFSVLCKILSWTGLSCLLKDVFDFTKVLCLSLTEIFTQWNIYFKQMIQNGSVKLADKSGNIRFWATSHRNTATNLNVTSNIPCRKPRVWQPCFPAS